MRLIGRECKCSNALSGPILICRGLDLSETLPEASESESEGSGRKGRTYIEKATKRSSFDESESPGIEICKSVS